MGSILVWVLTAPQPIHLVDGLDYYKNTMGIATPDHLGICELRGHLVFINGMAALDSA